MKTFFNNLSSDLQRGIFFRNMFLILFLLGIIFFSTGWHVFSYLGDKGVVQKYYAQEFFNLNGHNRTWYEVPFGGKFFTGFFQQRLEKASVEHFPLPVLLGYMSAARVANRFILSVLPISWAPVVPAGGDILSLRKEERLVSSPQIYFPEERRYLTARAQYYNEYADKYPGVRFFVIPILPTDAWLAMSNTFWEGSQDVLAGNKWAIAFESLLNPIITYSWAGKGLSVEDGVALYYLTDHHFKMPGAYTIYRQLIGILGYDSPAEYQALEADEWFTISNVQFRGAHARFAGKFDEFYDVLEDADFGFPIFQVEINSSQDSFGASTSIKEQYLKGEIPEGGAVRHYTNYYGYDYGLIHYSCADAQDRNLLVISDSFDNTLTSLLGSHYRQSYFVDLRHYIQMLGETFKLGEFIEEHEISDVLFFGRQSRILGFNQLNQ